MSEKIKKQVSSAKIKKSKPIITLVCHTDSAESSCKLLSEIRRKNHIGICLFEDAEIAEINGKSIVACGDNIINWMITAPLDEAIVVFGENDSDDFKREFLDIIISMGIKVYTEFSDYENPLVKYRSEKKLKNTSVNVYAAKICSKFPLLLKRLFDIFVSLIGCILSLPIILLVAIPLLIESPGPLFFVQKRVGKNGRVFKMLKLRSMYKNADEMKSELMEQNEMKGLMFKMKNDPRITKVGKFIRKTSIDELPQFFNILKGDMSLIGTRPPTYGEFELYSPHHKRRLSMTPGLTGLWQVSGRNNIDDFEEVVKLDTQYIDNFGMGSDIKIMFKTIAVVFSRKGSE